MKCLKTTAIAALFGALASSGCNDHYFVPDDEAIAAQRTEGVFSGTLEGSPAGATDFVALVLADDTFWMLYGAAGPDSFDVEGFARGAGTWGTGLYSSTQATDFGGNPPAGATLEADWNAQTGTLAGELVIDAGETRFSGTALTDSSYDYSIAADLQSLVGSWDITDNTGIDYVLDVAADGSFSLAEDGGGCTGDGTITPHASGRNVFEVSLDFGSDSDCASPDTAVSGVVLVHSITSADADQLLLAANDAAKSFGFTAAGTRPSP